MDYPNIQFIAYVIDTGPVDNADGTSTYLGLPKAKEDIDARCELMLRAMRTASANLPQSSPPEAPGTTLKVFMAPEFYFRGSNGAYDMDSVQYAIGQLQTMVAGDEWADWFLAFGTIVGSSSPTDSVAPYHIATTAQIEVYNFTLLQRGGSANAGSLSAKVVMKEMMSGIDFIADVANPDGLLLGEVVHMHAGQAGPGREQQQVDYDGAGVFTLDGITWGVDICLDHSMGRLVRSPQLPGEALIQVQLIPSCGMSIQQAQVTAEDQGYVFSCDGLGNGSDAVVVTSVGSPPVRTLVPIAPFGSFAVPDDALESDQSPPQTIAVDKLYRDGAGAINIYAVKPVPPAGTVAGTPKPLNWKVSNDYQFNFSLVYDANDMYKTMTCKIVSTNPNFKGLSYFLPLALKTTDASGGKVSINMKLQAGSYGYQHAVWCKINVPGFIFEGVAFEFYADSASGDPSTCW